MDAVIYARYSAGPRQTDQSIEGQVRVCQDYCHAKGLTVQEVYADRHISGKTDQRPEFQRLIGDAKRGKFQAVVVYKTDRFARNRYDSAIYKKILKQHGVRLFFAAEATPEGPEGIILESLMEGLAEYYSAELSQKIKRGMHESALKCKCINGVPPFGYRKAKDLSYEIDEGNAEAVREVFRRYTAGEKAEEIRAWLNTRGYRGSRGRLFSRNAVPRMLRNRIYIGEYSLGGVTVEDGVPAIVSKEVFYLAQKELDKRKMAKKPVTVKTDYLLSGRLFCGECGAPMTGVSGTSKTGEVHHYYYCREQRRKGCKKKPAAKPWLETLVADLTADYLMKEDVLKDVARRMYLLQEETDDAKEKVKAWRRRLTENETAQASVLQAVKQGLATTTLLKELDRLEKEHAQIEDELTASQGLKLSLSEDQLLFFLSQYIKRDQEDPGAYRARLIEAFVSRVDLWEDKIVITYNLGPQKPGGDPRTYDLPGSTAGATGPLKVAAGERVRIIYGLYYIKVEMRL